MAFPYGRYNILTVNERSLQVICQPIECQAMLTVEHSHKFLCSEELVLTEDCSLPGAGAESHDERQVMRLALASGSIA